MELTALTPKTLYIISTPIGNMKDITLRALETLKQVDIILGEDTRSAHKLLSYYGIQEKKVVSYHSHNEKQRLASVLDYFNQEYKVALISDAGTPLICDPGNLLVKTLVEKKIRIESLPGASALMALLPITGFSLQDFLFVGFLSSKPGKRRNQLEDLVKQKTVLIFYEAPHRMKELVEDLYDIFDKESKIVIGRELTKPYESIYREKIANILTLINGIDFVYKGEFCIIVSNR